VVVLDAAIDAAIDDVREQFSAHATSVTTAPDFSPS
jgi:hypothetical protein